MVALLDTPAKGIRISTPNGGAVEVLDIVKRPRVNVEAPRIEPAPQLPNVEAPWQPETTSCPWRRERPKSSFTRDNLVAMLLVAAVAAVVFGAKPSLRLAADRAYRAGTADSLFLSSCSAARLYRALSEFPSPPPEADKRLREIDLRAKSHFLGLANDAIKSGDLGAAIKNLKRALAYGPGDADVVDALTLLQTKHDVQASLAKQDAAP